MTPGDGQGFAASQDLTQQIAAIRATYDTARQTMHDALEQMLDEIRARYHAETRRLRGDGLMHPETPSAPGSFKAARGCLPMIPRGPRMVEVRADDLMVYGERIARVVRGDPEEDARDVLIDIGKWLARLYRQ